jgi:DNA-binding CsgD family transcriptional regulator
LSEVELLSGDWGRAERYADEGYDAALQTGQPSQQAVLAGSRALVAAHTGDVEVARATAGEALRLADATGSGFAELLARWALGLLELSLGDAERAAHELEPLLEATEAAGVREPGLARFVPDAIEARIRLGQLEGAAELLTTHEERARRLDRPSALAAAVRCRGLLLAARTDLGGARAALDAAFAEHARVRLPFERGRTLLALGAVQRRTRQRRLARETLNQALAIFEELGAELWAGQAHAELTRIGGRAGASNELTPSEQRIAELVAEGKTNKEVAAILVVTHRTVESALTQIYRKLDIRSRTELARRLTTAT